MVYLKTEDQKKHKIYTKTIKKALEILKAFKIDTLNYIVIDEEIYEKN